MIYCSLDHYTGCIIKKNMLYTDLICRIDHYLLQPFNYLSFFSSSKHYPNTHATDHITPQLHIVQKMLCLFTTAVNM